MIEPKPTAAAVGIFLPAAACGKTRRRGVLSRALREDALKAANKKPHPQMRAGERGDAVLTRYRDGTQKNAVMPSEPGTL